MSTWDAVWLNDEIDLLLWRLDLLRDAVDRVLVVEGDRYFSGGVKPSCFLENQQRIAALGCRADHVIVPLDADATSAWDRENQQRRGMADALEHLARVGDLIIAADIDEVPRPQTVRWLERHLDRPVRLHMQDSIYFANWVHDEPWRNSAWAYRHGQAESHPMLRVHLGNSHGDWDGYVEEFVPDAGWHLSFLGGPDAIRRKWAAYSHQDFNTGVDAYPGHLERCLRHGVHFQGRILLRKLTVVSEESRRLASLRADFLRIDKPTFSPAARAYRGWTWARRHPAMPAWLRRTVDDHAVVRCLLSPMGWLLDVALNVRRRWRPQPRPFPERQWQPPA